MNNRRFVIFICVLLVFLDDSGPTVVITAMVFMAGLEAAYLGLRWLVATPRRAAAEALARRASLELAFQGLEAGQAKTPHPNR
jgi:hypothetical protein